MNKRLRWLAFAALVVCAGGVLFRTPRALAKRALSPILKHVLGKTKKHQAKAAMPTPPLVIGYNLDFPGDWSNLMPFIDLMHDARPWAGCCSGTDPKFDAAAHLNLDAQGWPRSLHYRDLPSQSYAWIETVFSTQESVPDIGKTFAITWEGEGELEFFGFSPVSVDQDKRIVTFVFQPGAKYVRIVKTDPNGNGKYLRNIRIFRQDRKPLLAKGEIFNPDMLDYLKPFRSVRFMDWMQSNAEEDRDALWSERPRFDYFHWCRQAIDPTDAKLGARIGGYPVEVLVALANKTGANPHFNMPYRYTDEWLIQFATYVRDHLAPNLRATVEYSNEVWNWGFPQADYANRQGRKLWPDEGSAWLQYMGMRASKMGEIWRHVFAGQEQRLRIVIAPQTGWPDVAPASLDCPRWVAMDSANKPCHTFADAIAITGYFSGQLQEKINQPVLHTWLAKGKAYAIERGLRQLEFGDIAEIRTGDGEPAVGPKSESLNHAVESFGVFQDLAAERHLDLYAYEGGTAFGSDDPQVKELLFEMTEQPAMYTLYRRLFSEFHAAGGTVFNCWGWIGPRDPWANVENLLDRKRTKYRAVVDTLAEKLPP
jgi:hypothetical protein